MSHYQTLLQGLKGVAIACAVHLPCDGIEALRVGVGELQVEVVKDFREYVDESLIEVWRIGIPGETTGCICETEEEARAMIDGDPEQYEITKIKMHREIFENLSEFDGF